MRSRVGQMECVRALVLAGAVVGSIAVTGCGMTAAPQPPSLELPQPVNDLTATRTGDQVALNWTIPLRDTSKVDLKGDVSARLCRREQDSACTPVATLRFAPGANATYRETLPTSLTAGAPRALNYVVELQNKRGRSAGPSNAATVLAGQAPAVVEAFRAELQKEGIILRWTPNTQEPYPTLVRLQRRLLTPQPAKPAQGVLAPPAEPAEQNLLVPAGGVRGGALDKDFRLGETYEYRAQRIARLTVNGKDIELDGPLSPAVRVDAQNIFAPSVPMGLAAVAVPGGNGVPAAIDLSWQPDADADLAGYAVYRREAGQPDNAWQRISLAQPVVGPGYHDAAVQPGKSYEYSVTAIGQNGRESGRSAPAQESVPQG